MWWLLSALLLLLGIIFALLRSHLVIHMKYVREADNDEMAADITALYGLLRLQYHLPALNLKSFQQGLSIRLKRKGPQGRAKVKKVWTWDEAVHFYHNFQDFKRSIRDYGDWISDTLGNIIIDKVKWKTRVGAGDAPETAVAAGIVWGVKSSILAQFLKYFKLETKPEVSVDPDYNETSFRTNAELRLHVSLFRLLYALVRLVVRIIRKGGARMIWSLIIRNQQAKQLAKQ